MLQEMEPVFLKKLKSFVGIEDIEEISIATTVNFQIAKDFLGKWPQCNECMSGKWPISDIFGQMPANFFRPSDFYGRKLFFRESDIAPKKHINISRFSLLRLVYQTELYILDYCFSGSKLYSTMYPFVSWWHGATAEANVTILQSHIRISWELTTALCCTWSWCHGGQCSDVVTHDARASRVLEAADIHGHCRKEIAILDCTVKEIKGQDSWLLLAYCPLRRLIRNIIEMIKLEKGIKK